MNPDGTFSDPAEARAYLSSLSPHVFRLGDTSFLHPDFAVRMATAVAQARAAGLPVTVQSGYRTNNMTGSGYDASGLSMHGYGAAIDVGGIGGPNSPQAQQWAQIASKNQVYNPYGIGDPHEFNHWQMVPWTLESRPDVQQAIINAKGNAAGIWNAISPVSTPVASAKPPSATDIDSLWEGPAQSAPATTSGNGVSGTVSFTNAKPGANAIKAPTAADIDSLWEGTSPSSQPTPAKITPPQPGSQPGAYGLVWDQNGGHDPKTGELVMAGKPMSSGTANPQLLAGATGILSGVPIAGPYLLSGVEALNALHHARTDYGGVSYANALSAVQGRVAGAQADYPGTTTAGNIAGGIVGTIPAMAMAPAAFGIGSGGGLGGAIARGGVSGLTGGLIGGADSGVRSNFDPSAIKTGAEYGAGFGLAGPWAAKLIGGPAAEYLSNVFTGTTAGARSMASRLAEIGQTPESAQNALNRMGPAATYQDVDPALGADAVTLSKRTGAPTSIMRNAALARQAGADQRMTDIVNTTLGPKPDAVGIMNEIRNREISSAVGPQTVRAALDSSMGAAKDPATVLSDMLATRSAAAKPLYEAALSQPVKWDPRLQQFLDDPVMKPALAKGVEIQRLESLADGTPFNPNDYVYKGRTTSPPSAPVPVAPGVSPGWGKFATAETYGETPNMKTLNVMKKGLDAMVEGEKDPVTGRLSQEGVALDKVRASFVQKLDDINPDYAVARQAWQGPTITQNAFNRGLGIFRNASGPSGINSTPGALDAWMKNPTTTAGEKAAAVSGARSAFEQMMTNSTDPAAKATMQASKGAVQQKLAAILGPDEANDLVKQLTFKYEDPIGQAFGKGMDIFKARQGQEGIQDTPDALRAWMKTADPAEIEAHRQGARQAVEQALTTARGGDVSAARSLFAKSTANREKLEAVFPNAGNMFDALDHELQMRDLDQRVKAGSDTALALAGAKRFGAQAAAPVGAAAPIIGEAVGTALGAPGGVGAAVSTLGRQALGEMHGRYLDAASARLAREAASGLTATGSEQQNFSKLLARAFRTGHSANALTSGAEAATNLLTRSLGRPAQNALSGP